MLSGVASVVLLAAMGAAGVAALRRATPELSPLERVAYGLPLGVVAASLALVPLATLFGPSAPPVAAVGGILLLAAMGGLGVAILRRAALDLDPLELLAYGATLGAVAGSLLLVPLGIAFGLSRPLVVLLGVGCAAGAATLWPVRVEPGRLRVPATVPALGLVAPALAPAVRSWRLPRRVSLLPALVLGVVVLRLAVFWSGAITREGDGLWAGQLWIWGDWSLHLGDTTSFAYGDNFPPEHPRLPGQPFAYHYLPSLTAAAMVVLGMQPTGALALQSFLFSVLIVLALYAFARRLTRSRGAATLAPLLFLLGGGLGWLLLVDDVDRSGSLLETLRERPWPGGEVADANLTWPNIYFALIESQRGHLYGLPLGLLVLTLLLIGVAGGRRRAFVAAGAVAGLLPLSHLGTFLALVLITPFVFFLFPGRWWRPLPARRWFVLPDPRWVLFFGGWIAIAGPQLLLQQGGRSDAANLALDVGWVAEPDPWPWYWLKNLGLFLPLLAFALLDRRLLPPPARRFVWAFMPVFAIANLVVFQPWAWDNTKVLLWWFLGASVVVAALLAKLWREHRAPLVRLLLGGAVASMVLSGVLMHLHQAQGKDRHRWLTNEELLLADIVRAKTPPDAVFAVGLQHNHPIPMLTGRRVMLSYLGWMWSYGIDSSRREADLRAIYALAPEAPALIEAYGLDYVVVGPYERDELGADQEGFRARYPTLVRTANYEVFAVGGEE